MHTNLPIKVKIKKKFSQILRNDEKTRKKAWMAILGVYMQKGVE